MKFTKRLSLMLVVLVCCVGCDQTTKSMARSLLADSATVSFLGDTLRFQLAYNQGAILSLGADLPHRDFSRLQ